jgi:RNA polymerase sigma-70 factor (ECF subfamily)
MTLPVDVTARKVVSSSCQRANERVAFEVLVAKYAEPIYRLALNMLLDPCAAEHVLQQTWLTASRELPMFGPERPDLAVYAFASEHCLKTLPGRPDRDSSALEKCLHHLEAEDRLAFLLRDVEGLDCDDIAWILEEQPAASRLRVHRVRLLLVSHASAPSTGEPHASLTPGQEFGSASSPHAAAPPRAPVSRSLPEDPVGLEVPREKGVMRRLLGFAARA